MGSMHPREQIPWTCPRCHHKFIEVTDPYVPSKPGMMATDKMWSIRHVGDVECDCDCVQAEIDMLPSHPPHKCLACSETIMVNEPEILVNMKYGRRYRHADDLDCQRAMRGDYGRRFVSGGLVKGK